MKEGFAINHVAKLDILFEILCLIGEPVLGHCPHIDSATGASPTREETTMTLKTMLTAAFSAAALSAAVVAAIPAQAQQMPSLQRIADELELARIPAEVEIAVDRKDWPRARSFFADTIRVDFTSLVGGQPATIPADGLIQGWSGNLRGNKQSLHMRGQPLITITGDAATVYSNGYAYNRMSGAPDGSGDLWEVWGAYTHELQRTSQGWRITSFTFQKMHERGSNWVKTTPGS
jgi:hypothetical protein